MTLTKDEIVSRLTDLCNRPNTKQELSLLTIAIISYISISAMCGDISQEESRDLIFAFMKTIEDRKKVLP